MQRWLAAAHIAQTHGAGWHIGGITQTDEFLGVALGIVWRRNKKAAGIFDAVGNNAA